MARFPRAQHFQLCLPLIPSLQICLESYYSSSRCDISKDVRGNEDTHHYIYCPYLQLSGNASFKIPDTSTRSCSMPFPPSSFLSQTHSFYDNSFSFSYQAIQKTVGKLLSLPLFNHFHELAG